jgi:hypothetical protein
VTSKIHDLIASDSMDFAVRFVLQNAYQLFPAACSCVYGAISTRWPAYRAAGAVAVSLLLLVLQPLINQAAATGLTGPLLTASWAVIYTWEMLDSGFLQRAAPSSMLSLFKSSHLHIISGMQSAHRRRNRARQNAKDSSSAVSNQATQLTATQQHQDNVNIGSCGDHRGDVAADVSTAQKDADNSQLKQRNRPAITIQAFAGKPAVSSNQTSPTSSGSSVCISTSRASSSSDGGSSTCTTQAAPRVNSYSRTLLSAAVILACRIVLLQLAYAALLGLSGSTCPIPVADSAAAAAAAAGQQNQLESACFNPHNPGSCDSSSNSVTTTYSLQASPGVSVATLIRLFSSTFPLLARHIYAFVAGMLVPVQIEVTWAAVRLFVAATGNAAQLASLPATAFDNLMMTTSISDLWGRRWHQFFVSVT